MTEAECRAPLSLPIRQTWPPTPPLSAESGEGERGKE